VSIQAALEARWLSHDRHVGTEHLLLGLSGQYVGVVARVLREHGATPGMIRKEIMESFSWGYTQEDRKAASGKTIEAWVGRHASVAVENMGNGEPGRFRCILERVDGRGIVVSYESEANKIIRFCPWHTVPYINLARSAGAKQPPGRAGFSSTSSPRIVNDTLVRGAVLRPASLITARNARVDIFLACVGPLERGRTRPHWRLPAQAGSSVQARSQGCVGPRFLALF
jgi:hypothetical protein